MKNIQVDGQTRGPANTGQVTVGTTSVSLGSSKAELKFGVKVFADADNTDPVWVGYRSTLSTTGQNAGVKIAPGWSEFFPATDVASIHAISSAVSQSITFLSI